MPFVKDSLSLLIEASASDLNYSTTKVMKESTVRSGYASIEEVSESVVYGPEIVPVVQIGNEFFTEMNFLHPFMKTNRINSIAEALNMVARANGLREGAIGLLIESEKGVDECIGKALESGGNKKKDGVLDKIGKAVDLSGKLKKKGIKVKKKKADVCPECGKVNCECSKKFK